MLADHQPVQNPVNQTLPRRLHSIPAHPSASAAPSRPALSDREVEVLLAWLRAESKDEAARELFISPSTVSTHIIRIRAKYRAAGRPAKRKMSLFARAIQDGYTTLDEW
ncbi:putative LuxR family transcriptional regulator [Gordonia hirsuta DSM 44140 = NBRC 16056]|uniref:Putative LuxR family transcriptional regulator n=1 Tax=Gordonia hirsuta DSM 44140 = NBRC 16056 TaxID=1121927 RepID=L7L7C6_9ACTN|nr:putative LuxR family transcriptional regulator [Gordonia hirsuta DSM 44140 = NBRC 16056]